MNPEYSMFTEEDPTKVLKSLAKQLPLHKRWKIAPHIRRADAMVKKSQKWRDVISSDAFLDEVVASAFVLYFDQKVDKNKFISISRDPGLDFVKFVSGLSVGGMRLDDKYLRKANEKIVRHSDQIDAFIKAFIAIRLAATELKKLRS